VVLKPGVTNFQKAVANLWIDENNILNRKASRKHIGEIDPRYIYLQILFYGLNYFCLKT